MAISKVKLPDNTTQDIKDSRITGVDSTPTANSQNVVTSGGIKAYVDNAIPEGDFIIPVTSEWDGEEETYTFSTTMTAAEILAGARSGRNMVASISGDFTGEYVLTYKVIGEDWAWLSTVATDGFEDSEDYIFQFCIDVYHIDDELYVELSYKSGLGSNDDKFIIPVTYSNEEWSTTATYQEIREAILDGKDMYASLDGNYYGVGGLWKLVLSQPQTFGFQLSSLVLYSGILDIYGLRIEGTSSGQPVSVEFYIMTDSLPTRSSFRLVKSGGIYSGIHPAVITTQPLGGFVPNTFYRLGTLTGSVSFTLASPSDSAIVNHYYWTFETGSTAPTITWPNGITWIGGSAPTINANKHYEISVIDNVGTYMEV